MRPKDPIRRLAVLPARWEDTPPIVGTRQAIAAMTNRHPDQIKRYCVPIACDVQTRAPLYDADNADALLRRVRRRVAC